MKTYNHLFTSCDKLEKFLKEYIQNKENVLLQMFIGYKDPFIIKKIVKTVKDFNKNVSIIGTTTDGEILENYILTSKIVLSFTIFEKTYLKTSYVKIEDSYKAGMELAAKAVSEDTKAIIIFADGLHTNLEEFLKGFESVNNTVLLAG
jgi:hypothetical protein